MSSIVWLEALGLAAGSFGVGFAALATATWWERRAVTAQSRPAQDLGSPELRGCSFYFDGTELLDASPAARELLEDAEGSGDWERTLHALERKVPGAAPALRDLPEDTPLVLCHDTATDSTRLDARKRYGLITVTLSDGQGNTRHVEVKRDVLNAMELELGFLKTVALHHPHPIWREDESGRVLWANRAYLSLTRFAQNESRPWPLPQVFPPARAEGQGPAVERLTLKHDTAEAYFDRSGLDYHDGAICYAIDASGAVKAQEHHRQFVQTLAKTFAHFSAGLAIFDRERRLILFNPALADLTRLDPAWLGTRPTLVAFIDRLRETRMVAEPKDYKRWRQQLAEIDRNATLGTYQEDWALPSGQTYRVTGRPHPEGAVVFLFEDISAEIQLARRYRAELELGQSVIDASDEALAVFADTGELVTTNTAYRKLWAHDPAACPKGLSIVEATRYWAGHCRPTPVWGDTRDFASTISQRSEWTADLSLLDGTALTLRCTPLVRGATLVGFRRCQADNFDQRPASMAHKPEIALRS